MGTDDTWAACWNSSVYGKPILDKLAALGLSRADSESFYILWQNFTQRISASISSAYKAAPQSQSQSQSQALGKLIIWGGESTNSSVIYNLVDRDDVQSVLPSDQYIMEVCVGVCVCVWVCGGIVGDG